MDIINKLFIRHYNACINRGVITPDTNDIDFSNKINEEKGELSVELLKRLKSKPNNYEQEAIDLIMVTINMLRFNGVDIEKELLINVLKQEERANDRT